MTIEIRAKAGTKETLIDIGKDAHKMHRALNLALNEVGSSVVNDIANFIFNPPKTGRIYTYKGRQYQASAPGESPANRTGKLAKSSYYKVRNYGEMRVGETAEYSGYLEFGTERMKPRPHIIRAINKNHRNLIKEIEDRVRSEKNK